MDYETRTFFKGLADQIGEDEVRDILERRYTVIDSGGALKEVDCSNTSICR